MIKIIVGPANTSLNTNSAPIYFALKKYEQKVPGRVKYSHCYHKVFEITYQIQPIGARVDHTPCRQI